MPSLEEIFEDLTDEEKVILYALGTLGYQPLRSKTKLEKLLFLLSNVFKDLKGLLRFEPYLLGPYSQIVDDSLEDLMRYGLVDECGNSYFLTEKGKKIYDRLTPEKELLEVLEDFKQFLNDLPDDELLAFIYVTYPEYKAESAKWNYLQNNRVEIALSLLKKQKVSFNKAVEISGLSANGFLGVLQKRGVHIG